MLYEVITFNVKAGGDSHLFEHKCEIFRSNVAGGAFNKRTAAHSAERTVKMGDADLQRGQGVITSYSIHYTKLYEYSRR